MELIQGSETSANYNLTPGKYPEENIQFYIPTSRAVCEHGTWFAVLQMFFRADEGFVSLADQLVGAVVQLRAVAVDHVPVVTDHHTLLEERLVGTSVCEPASLQVTHVVQLATVQSDISITVD